MENKDRGALRRAPPPPPPPPPRLRISAALLLAAPLAVVGCRPVAGEEGDADARAHALIRAVDRARAEQLDPEGAGIDQLVPALELADWQGGTLALEALAGPRATLIAVRAGAGPADEHDGYQVERLARLELEYAARGVAFVYAHVGPAPEAGAVRREIEERGLRGTHVLDEAGLLGRALGVEAGGLVFVLDRSRTLRYRGALDEHWTGGKRRGVAGRDFVVAALEAVLANHQVDISATRASGTPVGIERVEPPIPEQVTFQREVARVFQASCVECHHSGGVGPFVLDEYQSAYDQRRMIRFVVEAGIMPPWYAVEDPGTWKLDRRLSQRERDLILAWVDAGAPEGDPAEAPTPLRWDRDWAIGRPDLIFQLAEVQEIPAEGGSVYRRILADQPIGEDLWIERLEVRPSDPSVVHHASVFALPPPENRPGEEADPEPGGPRWSGGQELLWGYAPGRPAGTFDTGTARFVPRGSQILFEMHYTPSGRATSDRTQIGFVLAKVPTPLVAKTFGLNFMDVDIPPGATREYSMEYQFERAVRLRSLTPHMHYRGSSFQAELLRADGRRDTLISVPAWDFDWQHTYQFQDGPYVGSGDAVRMTGSFDNSAQNPANPDPSARVQWGLESTEEMLMLGIEWELPRDDQPAQAEGL